jgi:hypothetical protein
MRGVYPKMLPGFVLFGGFATIAFVGRESIGWILSLNLLLFLAWILLLQRGFKDQTQLFFILYLLCRIPFFFNLPELSDDFYRFLWDGMLLNEGLNPLGMFPDEVRVNNMNSPQFARELLTHMNSADYVSVYPPFHQAFFALAYFFGGTSLLTGVNALRFIIVVSELALLIYVFTKYPSYSAYAKLYLLNPLVVIEGVGNVHMEAALLPFLAASFINIEAKMITSGAITYASAILTKLRPLILVPLLMNYLSGRARLRFFFLTATIVLLFVLMFEPWKILIEWDSGLGLYFGNFEFNASIYYLLRELLSLFTGHNPIYFLSPALSIVTIALIVWSALKMKGNSIFEQALVAYLIFLLLNTTVHPWYIIPLVFFALVSDRKYILIWSFAASLSYSHYLQPIGPKLLYLMLEYGLLFLAIYYEHRRRPWIQPALRG